MIKPAVKQKCEKLEPSLFWQFLVYILLRWPVFLVPLVLSLLNCCVLFGNLDYKKLLEGFLLGIWVNYERMKKSAIMIDNILL